MRKLYLIIFFSIVCSFAHAGTAPVTFEKSNTTIKIKVRNDGTLAVRSLIGEAILFVFDLDGKLVRQALLDDNKMTISGLNKGEYLFSILKDDETLRSGKLSIH